MTPFYILIFALIVSLVLRYLKKHHPDHRIFSIHDRLHWVYQVLPPFLLVIFFTTNGPSLLFLASVVWFVGFISLISVLIRLVNYKKNKNVLLRPLMAVFIAGTHFALVTYSVNVAEKETLKIAQDIEKECNFNMECPVSIKNRKGLMFKNSSTKVGNIIKFPVTYKTSGSKFTLYLHTSLDMGKNYSSGVKEPLKITSTF